MKKLKRNSDQKLALQLRRINLAMAPLLTTDLLILQELAMKGTLAATELARKVQLTSGSMTAALNRLEKGELVARVTTDLDRRKVFVKLTEEGKAEVIKGNARQQKELKKLLGDFSEREVVLLSGLMKRLRKAADGE